MAEENQETIDTTGPQQYEQLLDVAESRITAPQLPAGGTLEPIAQQVQEKELEADVQMPETPLGPVTEVQAADLNVPVPSRQQANTYQAFVSPNTPEFTAAQGQVSAQSVVGDIQGAVSEKSVAQAATGELDQRATVKYQLGDLFSSLEEGKPLPAWAAPAVRTVGAEMAKRGLGASSMAAAAITQAIMESGIPIAAQDAKSYATIQMQNLNNQQQATLQNAATYAAMDKANLDARMQAAVNNARAFLSIDTANLTNRQQLQAIDLQAKFQKLTSDSAAQNAAAQFNAKTQNQVNEFYEELGTQIQSANIARQAAIRQINAGEKNANTRYFSQLASARDSFNTKLQAQINQSNAVWRREINTANTALQNETNRLNAGNLLNLTTNAQNYLWQRYRDEASWLMASTESAKDRAHAVAMFAQQAEFNQDTYEKQQKDLLLTELGMTVFDLIFGDN